jgi:hypothetical protein
VSNRLQFKSAYAEAQHIPVTAEIMIMFVRTVSMETEWFVSGMLLYQHKVKPKPLSAIITHSQDFVLEHESH